MQPQNQSPAGTMISQIGQVQEKVAANKAAQNFTEYDINAIVNTINQCLQQVFTPQ
jgi:hypothetical protein